MRRKAKPKRYLGRAPTPPTGGPMKDKRTKRQRTRAADEQAWQDEHQQEQDAILDELEAWNDAIEGR